MPNYTFAFVDKITDPAVTPIPTKSNFILGVREHNTSKNAGSLFDSVSIVSPDLNRFFC